MLRRCSGLHILFYSLQKMSVWCRSAISHHNHFNMNLIILDIFQNHSALNEVDSLHILVTVQRYLVLYLLAH